MVFTMKLRFWAANTSAANGIRVTIGLPGKRVIPDKIGGLRQKKVRRGRCHLQRSPPSRHPLQTHVCVHSISSPSHTFLFFTRGHLTAAAEAAAAYGGRPRPGPTNHTNKPAAALSGPVTLQVVIQAHASFYVAILAAPVAHRAISEGIISRSMWHYRCTPLRCEKLTCLPDVEGNANSVIIDISHWLVQL